MEFQLGNRIVVPQSGLSLFICLFCVMNSYITNLVDALIIIDIDIILLLLSVAGSQISRLLKLHVG